MIEQRVACRRVRGAWLAVVALLWFPTMPASGQPAASGQPESTVAVEPIECWWRTSANAIRVSELFTIVLTCSVLETATTTVVPDQSRLDPAVMQLLPFEIVGGKKADDIRTPFRRFVQYKYSARYLGEEFGKDVTLPPLSITYRVQSRVQDKTAVESRDRNYVLPAQPIRIQSLVPAGAEDIRDRPEGTFDDIETGRFRASLLRIMAWALFGLSAGTLIVAAARLLRTGGAQHTARVRLASDGAILGAVARELAAVRHQRQLDDWTPQLASRALAALRLAGAYAFSRPVAQVAADPAVEAAEGQLLVPSTFRRGKATLVSGSITADAVGLELRRAEKTGHASAHHLADLHVALVTFSRTAYGRDGDGPDSADLDEALTSGTAVTTILKREHGWLVTRLRALRRAGASVRGRAWAR